MLDKKIRKIKRHKRIRCKILGNLNCPRLSVFRSNKYIYAQLIDDSKGHVLVSASEKELKKRGNKSENAFEVGRLLALKAIKNKIKRAVFDRGGYLFHGRVKKLAEGARKEGLIF